jgi:hypothetical protein
MAAANAENVRLINPGREKSDTASEYPAATNHRASAEMTIDFYLVERAELAFVKAGGRPLRDRIIAALVVVGDPTKSRGATHESPTHAVGGAPTDPSLNHSVSEGGA